MFAVSNLLQGDSRASDVFGDAKNIEIALIAEPGIKSGIDFMREAFEKHELDSVPG